MKTIITGGGGFIGKSLAATLEKRGIETVIVDRLNGREAGEYFTNAPLDDVDVVFHLAAQTSVFNANKDDIIHDNITVFKIVCDACRRGGVRLVYASSSTAERGNATSLYGISKAFAEQYASCYYPGGAVGVRFHNVYGPHPRQGTLLWNLLTQERVRLYNRGRNVRHFTYIDDIIESLLYAVRCDRPLVNAVNPEETTTLQLAQIVKRFKPLEIELVKENREFDRAAQSVNEGIFTVPLPYTSVQEGIEKILGHGTM